MSAAPDWAAIEREYRAGQLSVKEIARQQGGSVTDRGISRRAKANGWTRDLSSAVRNRVRESLVREGVRANGCEQMGVEPSDAAIVDEAAARGVAVVRIHRRDIEATREAAADLLGELSLRTPPDKEEHPQGAPLLKITERSRVISDLSQALARLVPLERQAFGLDEDKPDISQSMTVVWDGMPAPAYD